MVSEGFAFTKRRAFSWVSDFVLLAPAALAGRLDCLWGFGPWLKGQSMPAQAGVRP